jgi:hypothetical protein
MDTKPKVAKRFKAKSSLACFQCVLRPPPHLLHGPSPLFESVIPPATSNIGMMMAITPNTHRPSPRRSTWSGTRRIYEGPVARNIRYPTPPPHLSIWQADRRERTAFQQGVLPPYAEHLATPVISPLNEEETICRPMDIDQASDEELEHEVVAYPNWYQSPTSPKSRRTTLPPQMTVSEAGLRLRLIRIASACLIFPQLGAYMQSLLQQEIRAAMYREELALLSHFGAKGRFLRGSLTGEQDRRRSRGTKRPHAVSQGHTLSVEGVRKKMRTALITRPRPRSFDPQAVEDILCIQPNRHPPYMSDFMNEDEILERAWMECMSRRHHSSDLRKSVLLHSAVNSLGRPRTRDIG